MKSMKKTMTKRRTKRENGRLLRATLATGSVVATLIGADLLASKSWLSSVVETPIMPITSAAAAPKTLAPIPMIAWPDVPPVVTVPQDLPGMVAMPSLDLEPLPTVAVPQGMVLVASGGSAKPVLSVTLPQVAVPQIPTVPLVSQTAVSLDLPPIPSVTIPQPVVSGKTS